MFAWGGATVLAMMATLAWGSESIPLSDVFAAIVGGDVDNVTRQIVVELRLPRALTALAVGAALGVTGLQTQTVFRNALADPYVLGVSAGASLGAALTILVADPSVGFGVETAGSRWALVVSAALGAGAVFSVMIVVSAWVRDSVVVLVLGVMLAALVGAVTTILVFFADAERTRAFVEWGLGSFKRVTWDDLAVLLPVVGVGSIAALASVKQMNAMMLGDDYSRSVGMSVRRSRVFVLSSAALIAGATVAFTGPIGFLGIAVPHLARATLKTSDHKVLVPACVLIGAGLALACGFLAEMPGTSVVFPLNAATALIGAPVVFWVLLRMRGGLSI